MDRNRPPLPKISGSNITDIVHNSLGIKDESNYSPEDIVIYKLACELSRDEKWMLYLNAADGPAFLEIVQSPDLWFRFLYNPVEFVQSERQNLMYFPVESDTVVRPFANEDGINRNVDYPTLLSFRIREMIADYRLSRLSFVNIALSQMKIADNNHQVGDQVSSKKISKPARYFYNPQKDFLYDISQENILSITKNKEKSKADISNQDKFINNYYSDLKDFYNSGSDFTDDKLVSTIEFIFNESSSSIVEEHKKFFGQTDSNSKNLESSQKRLREDDYNSRDEDQEPETKTNKSLKTDDDYDFDEEDTEDLEPSKFPIDSENNLNKDNTPTQDITKNDEYNVDASVEQSEKLNKIRLECFKALEYVDLDDAYYTIDDFQALQLLRSSSKVKTTLLENGTGVFSIPGYEEQLRKLYAQKGLENKLKASILAYSDITINETPANKKEEVSKFKSNKLASNVHSSFRHLYLKLHSDMEKNGSADEFRKLLCDIRPNKSKWFDEYRIGQDKLYDHLEKMLEVLKNVPTHSKLFLKPVTLKEAPNYFDIIKHPMDLSTVEKRLKNHEYISKQQFADDCYLIWSNCMTYCQGAANDAYRKSAVAMKRKTTERLKRIPDIVIKVLPRPIGLEIKTEGNDAKEEKEDKDDADDGDDQSAIDMEGRSLNRDASNEYAETEGDDVSSIRPNKALKSVAAESIISTMDDVATVTTAVSENDEHSTVTNIVDGTSVEDGASVITDNDRTETQEEDQSDILDSTLSLAQSGKPISYKGEEGNSAESYELTAVESDIATTRWRAEILKDVNNRSVFEILSNCKNSTQDKVKRVTLIEDSNLKPLKKNAVNQSFGLRKAIIRNFDKMKEYLDKTHEYREHAYQYFKNWKVYLDKQEVTVEDYNGNFQSEDKENAPPVINDKESSIKSREIFYQSAPVLPEIKYFADTIPYVYTPTIDHDPFALPVLSKSKKKTSNSKTLPSLSDFPEIMSGPTRGLISLKISETIFELRLIKEIHSKIVAAEDNIGKSDEQDEKGVEPQPALGTVVHEAYKPITPLNHLPKLVINEMSAQSCLRQALSTILLSVGFEHTLESTLSVFMDIFKDQILRIGKTVRTYLDLKSSSWPLEKIVLHSLYENGMDQYVLDEFIKYDVIKQANKTHDLRLKLVYAYNDMMNLLNYDDSDAIEHDDAVERIMSGNFMEEMGVDFLNLRDFGLEFVNVPTNLWNKKADKPIKARVRYKIAKKSSKNDEDEQDNKVFEDFSPLNSKTEIGLLQLFYKQKLEEQKQEVKWIESDREYETLGDISNNSTLMEDLEKDPSQYILKSHILLMTARVGRKSMERTKEQTKKKKKSKK